MERPPKAHGPQRRNNSGRAPPHLPIPIRGRLGALGLHYLPRARKNAPNVVYIMTGSAENNNGVRAPSNLPILIPGYLGAQGLHYLPSARKNAPNVLYIKADSAEMPSGSKRAHCSSDEIKEESSPKKTKKTENGKADPGFKKTKTDKN